MDLKPFTSLDPSAGAGGSPVTRNEVQRAMVAADQALHLAKRVRALHQNVNVRAERAQRLAHQADAKATHAYGLATTAETLARVGRMLGR